MSVRAGRGWAFATRNVGCNMDESAMLAMCPQSMCRSARVTMLAADGCNPQSSARSHSEMRSASIKLGKWMLLEGMVGMRLASAMYKPSMPNT